MNTENMIMVGLDVHKVYGSLRGGVAWRGSAEVNGVVTYVEATPAAVTEVEAKYAEAIGQARTHGEKATIISQGLIALAQSR